MAYAMPSTHACDNRRSMPQLLEVNNLQVDFRTKSGPLFAVRGVSFHIKKGEIVALVGESGCGKSVTAQSLIKLLPASTARISGSVLLEGKELLDCDKGRIDNIRGKEISMVFQNPMSSLNPTMCIGEQIAEVLIKHENISRSQAYKRVLELLILVGIPQPEMRIRQYPHEFSGGMRQRVVIAIALACYPKLLIADEPTTALDVTIQAQILELMVSLQKQFGMSIILITHDLGVVADTCDRVIVMYAGQVVEEGTVDQIFYNARHPYTQLLLKSLPKAGQTRSDPLYSIEGAPPHLTQPPSGCSFTPRCPYAMRGCPTRPPPLMEAAQGQKAACWLYHPHSPHAAKCEN